MKYCTGLAVAVERRFGSSLPTSPVEWLMEPESFVKTMKRDYTSIMPEHDGLTAAK